MRGHGVYLKRTLRNITALKPPWTLKHPYKMDTYTIVLYLSLLLTELYFTDVSISTVFVFDTIKKNLKRIEKGEETITIEYSQSRPMAFNHSSGGRITVTYNNNALVREALLEDKSGKKQRWSVISL